MDNVRIVLSGFDELKKAIERNPKTVINETKNFIQRALAQYRSGIQNNPWRIGMSGGGSPVATGNLRDTHFSKVETFDGFIRPTASYAGAVHKDRPWLDFVFQDKMTEVNELEKELLDKIIKDLAL